MAILRIYDGKKWIPIPAIKGEQGEQGKQGEQGRAGPDGVGISKMEFNDAGELLVTYTDESSVNLGRAAGIITKTEINDNGELVITYSDNKTETLGRVAGKDGDTPYIGENGNWYIDDTDTEVKAEGNSGVYVGTGEMPDNCNVQIDPSGEEITALPNPHALTFTGAATGSYDGSTPLTINIPEGADGETPYIKDGNWWIGETDTGVKAQGADGKSVTIQKVTESILPGGENVVTFSDGKILTVRNGEQGVRGKNGNDGAGIESIEFNEDYSLTITTEAVRNGNEIVKERVVYTSPSLKGEQGVQGIQGEQGESGVYVGAGTPPTGTKVQVNPDGESIEILTAEETRSIITEMLADKAQLTPEYADSVEELEEKGDPTKLYVLPDGYIYAYATTTTTIVPTNQIPNSVNSDGTPYIGDNGEKGYRPKYRINSAEEEVPTGAYACTGFMPFKADDFIRSKNLGFDNLSNSQIRLYDSNFVRLVIITGASTDYPLSSLKNDNGDLDGRLSDAITSVDDATKAAVAYIRIVALTFDDTAILTRNEPTETQTITQESWYNTGHAFVPADYEDRIIGVEEKAESNSNRLGIVEETLKGFSPDIDIPVLVKEGASALVDKALSREDSRIIRFLINSDAHQKNDDTLIRKGTKELAQAHKSVLSQMGVDFVANLGDITWGSSGSDNTTVLEEGKAFNGFFLDSVRGQTSLWTEGNHETGMLTASQIYGLIYTHNKGLVQDTEHLIEGYGYMDFPNQKVRVICLNTNQGTASGNVSGMSNEQLEWFAEKALDMSDKTDWSVITLGHHPLSYNTVSLFRYAVETIKAFINGDDFSFTTNDGFTFGFNYGGKNCQYVGHFHGHAHAFSVVKMQRYVASGSYEEIDAWEICIPNACYTRNNQYKGNGTYVERYSTETTYNKADIDGQRTSFNLVTVCLDEKKIYADNYGAGIDRVINY